MIDRRSPGPLLEDGNPITQEEVFENLDIADDRLSFDLALAGDGAGIEHRPVRKADRFEKSGELADISDDPFGLDFLFEVERGVAPEDVVRAVGGDDQGQKTGGQGFFQGKGISQFRGHEGMHGFQKRPAGQEIDAGLFELSRARSRQDESA